MRSALAGIAPNAPVANHDQRPGLKINLDSQGAVSEPVVSNPNNQPLQGEC